MIRTTGGSLLRVLAAALGAYAPIGVSITAHAQATPSAAPAAGDQVENVIVTARRRNESVQATPLAVTAISPAELGGVAAPTIVDLTGRVPSLVLVPVVAGPSAAAVTIRGIGFSDIEKSFDPAVGVLIDDVYIGTNTGQLTDTFDLQSVEVLRGPQGTLFGRNTIGGVISLERTRPTGEFGGAVDATIGDYGRQDYHVVLNFPKIADQLSTKIFYSSRETDGYLYNATLNSHKTANDDIGRAGIDFLWQPRPNIDLNLTLEHENERGHVDQPPLSDSTDLICSGIPGLLPPNFPPLTSPSYECNRNKKNDLYTTYSENPGQNDNNENDITAQGTWRLAGVTLNSVTGYRKSNEFTGQDFDSSSVPFYETQRQQAYEQFSQEFRANGELGHGLDYVAGVYYFSSKYFLYQKTTLPFFSGYGYQYTTGKSLSYAGFGDLNWQIAPHWRLTVGGRYTDDHKSLDQDVVGVAGLPVTVRHSWGEFTPKVSVDYTPDTNVLLYASYSEGYRSGGLNGRAATLLATETPYNPETVDAYEVGAKTEWFERRLTFNVAAYDNEYNNKQESVVEATPPGSALPDQTVVANAASARIYGLELETEARPMRPLTLRGSLSLLHSEYGKFTQVDLSTSPYNTTQSDNLSTLHLINAPTVTANLGFDYRFPENPLGRLTLIGDYRYIGGHDTVITAAPGTECYCGTGGAYVAAVNDPRGYSQPARTIDASLNLEHDVPYGVLHVQLYVRNLTDDRGLASALAVAGLFTFGEPRPPRTYGVTVGYKF